MTMRCSGDQSLSGGHFVLCFVDCGSPCLGKSFGLSPGLTQRFLPFLDEFLTALGRLIPSFSPTVDCFVEFIIGTCRIIAEESAHLRACLWGEEQGHTRTNERSSNKCRYSS